MKKRRVAVASADANASACALLPLRAPPVISVSFAIGPILSFYEFVRKLRVPRVGSRSFLLFHPQKVALIASMNPQWQDLSEECDEG